jgi:hypothetical protein
MVDALVHTAIRQFNQLVMLLNCVSVDGIRFSNPTSLDSVLDKGYALERNYDDRCGSFEFIDQLER